MEALIDKIEEEEGSGKVQGFLNQDVSLALGRFAEALRVAVAALERETRDDATGDKADDNVDAKWLLQLCERIPSDLGPVHLARAVVDASGIEDDGRKQEALFNALGASEEAMEILFQIAPHLTEINRNITVSELSGGSTGEPTTEVSMEAQQVLEMERLRQEALDAAQVAALAQAEVKAIGAQYVGGSTHTISRASDVEAQKNAKRAAKRAEQALKRAKAAGAIIESSELLTISDSVMGSGGLMRSTQDELRDLQQSLQPEGSREYHREKGLPDGTFREECTGPESSGLSYERVVIPAPVLDASKLHARLRVKDVMDETCAVAFSGVDSLNPMQSTVFDTSFNRRENMLVCAPTGAGKTNVAMLTLIAHFRDVGLIESSAGSSLEAGQKVVYIAPMKALAQEVVQKYSSKLKPLGLVVRELTGDMQLTRAEADSSDVLVTTPEKWDVVTRKSGNDDNSLGNKCGLLIIDEVHLLADERGAVIESVVSRLHRLVESRQKQLRIVGLSATLPNYQDVAEFLQVPSRGLFFFGPEHRPVPLQQQFIGVHGETKKRHEMEEHMDDVCYETVKDSLARGYQVMVFVHSRKGTGDAATALARRATASGELDRYFITQGKEDSNGEAYKKFADRVKKSRNREVTNHFYNGMGIHHAGMLRGDRTLSEGMFADGAIKVLCTTATLAWGINLPAHTVIIKGTDVYNPEKGKSVDLSILDVQQIFGRAGRPQFDTSGEATLITNQAAMTRYLDKLVRAVPIESKFIKHLADHLNAEIVGQTVTTLDEAVAWLGYTYLYVRMLKNPLGYGVTEDQKADDPALRAHCLEIVRGAVTILESSGMVGYVPSSGNLGTTSRGRVAAHFYLQAESVSLFGEAMKLADHPTDGDLMRIVATATEFDNVRVRKEEEQELDSLQQSCPLDYEGSAHDSATKTFILLQTYISRERPKSFTLITDTNYIASNAGRVARAYFEICLTNDMAGMGLTALKLLRLAKSVDKQFWWFQSPLRHFESDLGMGTIKALESRHTSSGSGNDSLGTTLELLDLPSEEVGRLCRGKKAVGDKVKRLIGVIPNPAISCNILPVSQSLTIFEVEIHPVFEWNPRWHGGVLIFWLWVEDAQTGKVYHQEQVLFAKRNHPHPIKRQLHVPLFGRASAKYNVRLVSDSWVGVEMMLPVSLDPADLPSETRVETELLDLRPLPLAALGDSNYRQLFAGLDSFNSVQTQAFHVLYHTDNPVFLGIPTISGKAFLAEFAILGMKKRFPDRLCIYLAPMKSTLRVKLEELRNMFGSGPLHWRVSELSGNQASDRKAMENSDIVVCTPAELDLISRWWNRKFDADAKDGSGNYMERVRLLVVDDAHLVGEERGAAMESFVNRFRFRSCHSLQPVRDGEGVRSNVKARENDVRIVGLSDPVANPLDIADWIGIDTDQSHVAGRVGLYNFMKYRPVKVDVHVQGFEGKHYSPRMATMNKACYSSIQNYSPDGPSMIYVASRRQTKLTALDLISKAAAGENPMTFLRCDETYIEAIAEGIQDEALRHTINYGVGLHHGGLSVADRNIVETLYRKGEIRVIVATASLAWGTNLPTRLVIVKGTEFYDGRETRYVDYPLSDVLRMTSRAGRPGHDRESYAVVMVEKSKVVYYKTFLSKPGPIESCLRQRICGDLNTEVACGTVTSLSDATTYLKSTFYARRVKANPMYYGKMSVKDEDVDEFLQALALESLKMLEGERCLETEIDVATSPVHPNWLGKAALKYNLKYGTPQRMYIALKDSTGIVTSKMQLGNEVGIGMGKYQVHPMNHSGRSDETAAALLLHTLANMPEFSNISMRHDEEVLNRALGKSSMWGPDISGILGAAGSRVPDYRAQHVKIFLLMQAYLKRTRLPVSDYVNDAKYIIEIAPRLLSAMQFVVSQDIETSGFFETYCQLCKVRQLIFSRTTPQVDPIGQLGGIDSNMGGSLTKHLNLPPSANCVLWALRNQNRDKAAQILKKVPKKHLNGNSIRSVLDELYAIPSFTIEDAQVSQRNDKDSGKAQGRIGLKMKLDCGSRKGRANGGHSLFLVVGTCEHQIMLAHSEVHVTASGTKSLEKEVFFDWETAKAHGGDGNGCIVVRVLMENVRGMDGEFRLELQ